MTKPATCFAIALWCATSIASAEPTYEQWSAMGRKMYSAFRCAALAQSAKMSNEEFLRLFNKGVDVGRPLLNAIFEGRVRPRGDEWIMPLGALACGMGPTAEFVLGRIFECSSNDALWIIRLETDAAVRVAAAKRSYASEKCEAE